MKSIIKITTIFLLITYISVGQTIAQETTPTYSKMNSLKINPFAFGNSEFQLAYERYFNNRRSSVVFSPSIILRDSGGESKEGFQVMGQYRFYLTHFKKEPNRKNFLGVYNYGFYAGAYGLYFDQKETYLEYDWDATTGESLITEFTEDIQSVEGGAMLGLQMDITKRIVLDFYIGGGVRRSEVDDTNTNDESIYSDGIFDKGYTGVKPKAGLLLGITF